MSGNSILHVSAASPQDVLNSMQLLNDEALKNAPTIPSWTRHGNVIQGLPIGEAAPDYWTDAINDGGDSTAMSYTTGPWKALTAWFVLYPGKKNTASGKNIKVAINNMNLWILHADPLFPGDVSKGQWVEAIAPQKPFWAANYDSSLNYINDTNNISTNTSYNMYAFDSSVHPIHGGSDMNCIHLVKSIDGKCLSKDDVLGVFVRMQAWLVSPKAGTSILLSVGSDYYPNENVSSNDLIGAEYLPGVAGSRYKYITSTPQYFYMANVIDPNAVDTLGNLFYDPNNQFTIHGGKTYLTQAEFLSNPPPPVLINLLDNGNSGYYSSAIMTSALVVAAFVVTLF